MFIEKSLQCEICKFKFPVRFQEGNRVINLLDTFKPTDQPYLIFEANLHKYNGYYLVKMREQQTITVGRSHDCDLRLSDISVSRQHAHLSFEKGRLYLKDLNSKYGSQLLIQNPILIGKQQKEV